MFIVARKSGPRRSSTFAPLEGALLTVFLRLHLELQTLERAKPEQTTSGGTTMLQSILRQFQLARMQAGKH